MLIQRSILIIPAFPINHNSDNLSIVSNGSHYVYAALTDMKNLPLEMRGTVNLITRRTLRSRELGTILVFTSNSNF